MTFQAASDRFQNALQVFDDYNKKDPNEFIWEGQGYPREYFLSIKLYDWIRTLSPQASEALLLASRSQHLGRWEIPRDSYPRDREGYLRWRKDLSLFHADKTGQLLKQQDYPTALIERVQQIILKRKLKADKEVQVMENALCLVFLQFQYEDFWPQYTDKIVDILRKSIRKMDQEGHQHALTLEYSKQGKYYLEKALTI